MYYVLCIMYYVLCIIIKIIKYNNIFYIILQIKIVLTCFDLIL